MAARRVGLGGLPARIANKSGRIVDLKRVDRFVKRQQLLGPKPPPTSRQELMALLKRKSWQVRDLERHPVVLGVPLGQDGGPSQGVSVDIGLKTMATVSLSDLVDASPQLKEKLFERALSSPKETTTPVPMDDLLRKPMAIPMSVAVPEDMMKQPVASALHPRALDRKIADEKLQVLTDPFFRANPPSSELVDLVVEHVPGADKHVAAKEELRREQRAAMQLESANAAASSANARRGGGGRS